MEIEERHFWFRSRNRLLNWALKTYFPDTRNLLEIGCGTGFVLLGLRTAFPCLDLTGSDLFCEGLEFAKHVPNVTLLQIDARQIPFENEFQIVGAFDILEHIDEDDVVLRQMYQATSPGGGIIVTAPQHRFLWSAFDVFSGHQRRYVRKELEEKIERAGFRVVRTTSFVFFLLPLILVVRLLEKRKARDVTVEFKVLPVLNSCLEHILRFEQFLIRIGVSLPFGSSLMIIARKD
jgi:SAM-dependent methyltransferase